MATTTPAMATTTMTMMVMTTTATTTTATSQPSPGSLAACSASDKMPRVRLDDCLAQPQRRRIYEEIRDRPGRTIGTLALSTGLNPNTVKWHIQKLRKAGLVTTENHFGIRLCHSAAGGLRARVLGRAHALLADPRSSRIVSLARAGMRAEEIVNSLRKPADYVAAVIAAVAITDTGPTLRPQWGLVDAFPGVHKVPLWG